MTHALLLALALAASPPAAGAAQQPPPRVLNRVAATVNGEVITLRELEARTGSDYAMAKQMPPGPERDRAAAKALQLALDQIIAERLFAAQTAALGVETSEQEVDAAIEDIKKRNNLDDAALREALRGQGLDFATFRQTVKRDIEAVRVLQVKVRSRVKVTDEDVKNYWQTHPQEFQAEPEVHVRHVFVGFTPGDASAEARAQRKAEQLLGRIKKGEDFAAVARAESDGPSASDGGDLGWLKRGTIQPELERVAFALPTGAVSDVVRTRAGFQILKVDERRGGGELPFEAVKEEIRNRLVNEQAESYRAQFIEELKRDAIIDVKLPELAHASSTPGAATPATAAKAQ
ncbi:MAG TPA: peptidylprolyl isomerase [Anaeromyxobacteraceae bacterium]|nr:peptidylprolyl isomerase [Anaeromyxobacteraceae bacterium]